MSQETNPVMFAPDGHPDENQLLFALERELPAEDAARVEQHLGGCWSCRARFDEMQRGILTFVEYREKRYLPSLDTPRDDSGDFRARLRNAVSENKPDSRASRLWRRLFTLLAIPAQVKWVTAVATVMVLVIFWVQVLVNPRTVSANELLTRAVAAQNPSEPAGSAGRRRIVHQKIRIQSGQRTVVRDFQWTLGSPIITASWDAEPDPLMWNAPLTAEGFATWRSTLPAKADTVKRGQDVLTLDTIPARQDPIKEAWIIVRADDFHPVEQHVRFADDQQLDFFELAFRIEDDRQDAHEGEKLFQPVKPPAKSSPAPALPSVDLNQVELNLRYTLFANQWDLGEDLTITRADGDVVLGGIVSSSEREQAMRTALGSLPNVRFSVVRPAPSAGQILPPVSQSRQVSGPPLLKDSLENAFPSRQDRLAFIERCIAASDGAVSHAWALKKLVERYDDAGEQLLDRESDQKLHDMLGAHLNEIRRRNSGLDVLIPLLPPANAVAQANAPNRRAQILSLFTAVQEQDRLLASLLASSGAGDQNILNASLSLRTAHANISALLDGLR